LTQIRIVESVPGVGKCITKDEFGHVACESKGWKVAQGRVNERRGTSSLVTFTIRHTNGVDDIGCREFSDGSGTSARHEQENEGRIFQITDRKGQESVAVKRSVDCSCTINSQRIGVTVN
jgi:hypothetical protein